MYICIGGNITTLPQNLRKMELLVTASIGLWKCDGRFFMRVITADRYNFYDFEIPESEAIKMSTEDNIEITDNPDDI